MKNKEVFTCQTCEFFRNTTHGFACTQRKPDGEHSGWVRPDWGCSLHSEIGPTPAPAFSGFNAPVPSVPAPSRPLPTRTPLEKAQAKRDRRVARLRATHSAIEAAVRQADPATARRTDIRRRTYDPATISDPVPPPVAGPLSGGPGAEPPEDPEDLVPL